MLRLVQHFGDQKDPGTPCGLCDVCAPKQALTSKTSPISAEDAKHMHRILEELRIRDRQATGRLFRDKFEAHLDRKGFQELIHQLERAGLIQLEDDEFEKDGSSIAFQRALLLDPGRRAQLAELRQLEVSRPVTAAKTKGARGKERASRESKSTGSQHLLTENSKLVQRLKEWRRAMAADKQTPAYTIMTDRALYAIAAEVPRTEDALLSLHGIGKGFLEKYGQIVLALVRDHS
jgi:DNA topoisomerase-3